jgi:crotonobetainyl-CoA:carnitine CoA-transferase CaiB-like acyl-CoA transferase
VFLTNSRPGAMEHLGIDYETLRQYRADLVYCEITGFGTRGPAARHAGSDLIAQSYSGLLAAEAKLDEAGGPELIQCTGIVDFPTSFSAAMGICAALFHRERTGEGQYLTTSLLVNGMTMMGREISRSPVFDVQPGSRDELMANIEAIRSRGGSYAEVIEERGGIYKLLGPQMRLYYGGHPVKDGALIFGALTDANREAIRTIIGLEDDPTADPDFNGREPEHYDRIMDAVARMRAIMLTKTAAEWLALFNAAGVPVSKVNLPEELADDPQVEALGLMLDIEHELTGAERFVGPLVEMSATPTGSRRPSPPLGRHTDEILSEAGIAAEEVAALRELGAIA